MPIGVPMTMDTRFQDNFPWDLRISTEQFMSWPVGEFQPRALIDRMRINGHPVRYYLIRYPPLVAAEDKWRLTICPYFTQPCIRDIASNIARLYDVSKLIQQLFPNQETHPVVHEHETALYLLKEADYVQHIQIMMHWTGVDESTDTLLTFPNLNINDEPALSQPQPQRSSRHSRRRSNALTLPDSNAAFSPTANHAHRTSPTPNLAAPTMYPW